MMINPTKLKAAIFAAMTSKDLEVSKNRDSDILCIESESIYAEIDLFGDWDVLDFEMYTDDRTMTKEFFTEQELEYVKQLADKHIDIPNQEEI